MSRINAIRSGNAVTIYFNGTSNLFTFEREEDAKGLFRKALEAKSNPTEENLKSFRSLLDPYYKIQETDMIERDRSGNLYLKGFNIAMPRLMKEKIIEYIQEGFDMTPLINFWKLLMLNPDAHVRESLYDFAQHFNFPITDMGYFIAYKSVAYAGKRVEPLALKVCNSYVSIKASGKNPSNYTVICVNPEQNNKNYVVMETENVEQYLNEKVEDSQREVPMRELLLMSDSQRDELWDEDMEGYFYSNIVLRKEKVVVEGTLDYLFDSLGDMFKSEEGKFTDHHSRTMSIRLGEPVRMKRSECDNDPHQTCSRGLHVGTPQYVVDFGGRDSYILACLVNPMNVVAVPVDYKGQKMRCCEYLPYSICEFDNGVMKEIDTKYFEEDYVGYEAADLESQLAQLMESEKEPEKVQLISNRLKDITLTSPIQKAI